LSEELVYALYAGGQNGVGFGGVGTHDHDEVGLADVFNGTGISAVADRTEEPGGRGRLAVARAVIELLVPMTARANFCIR
jgi:hypothetical protein